MYSFFLGIGLFRGIELGSFIFLYFLEVEVLVSLWRVSLGLGVGIRRF